jgi:hypothetical protein
MKSIVFAFFVLVLFFENAMAAVSGTAAQERALAWIETAQAKELVLRQDLRLADGTVFRAGATFLFQEESSLAAVPVVYQDVVATHCENPDLAVEELTLVNPLPSDGSAARDPSVGVNLRPGCHLGIYIELADYESPSFFARP